MSVAPSNVLPLQPAASPRHYRASSTFTFHPYEHDPPNSPLYDDTLPPAAMSTRRASRISAPFPTFLYASEPPPLTARNKQRIRPTAAQLSELKALYAVTPHPAREVREALGNRIGMRYQSVTNWFQNQRSTAKKRAPIADQLPQTAPPRSRTRSRSRSRSRLLSPSPVRSLRHSIDDSMDDSYTSVTDDVRQEFTMERSHDYHDDHQAKMVRARTRTDPVRDIIVAQAAARQQQLNELPLPLSGAAIVPSSFSDRDKNDSLSTDNSLNITLPPPPRTTSVTAPSSRDPTPFLSTFQLSRPPSPSAASTAASNFETCGEEFHGTEQDLDQGMTADQVPRGKRSRPTPHQLAALRALHAVTSSPSIEERTKVGREIGMELGKVTNWFRNLRQTARKKERRALEAEGIQQSPVKRGRDRDSYIRQNKRSRLAIDDDDNNSVMSASPSMPNPHSGTFETSSTVGSMDTDYDHERQDAYFIRHHGDAFAQSRQAYAGRPQYGGYDNRPSSRSSPFDRPPSYLIPSRHDDIRFEGHPEHEHENDHESRSELGTESDAAHEAVTPEPQSLSPCVDRLPPTPRTAPSSRGSPAPADDHSSADIAKHPSVDDALLLLAFHGAQT